MCFCLFLESWTEQLSVLIAAEKSRRRNNSICLLLGDKKVTGILVSDFFQSCNGEESLCLCVRNNYTDEKIEIETNLLRSWIRKEGER